MSTYDDASLWGLLALLVLVTLVARNFFLVLPRRWQPRGALERALRAAPLAALVAITVPEILRTGVLAPDAGGLGLLLDARLLAALALLAVWQRWHHGVAALTTGSAVYLVGLAFGL
jgi:branched-subunit amino acid transport protein